jgi:hypothetical protein
MNKITEITRQQKKQTALKSEVKKIKKRVPIYIIAFILFGSISFFFLEYKFYHIYANNINTLMYIVSFLSFISFFLFLRSYVKIKKKQKEAKSIGYKLYNLMKLEPPKDA